MNFFKLAGLFVLKNIGREKFLAILSIIGIALGTGLFTGIKIASDRAISSFEADIKGLESGANYEITDASGIDFRESIFPEIAAADENCFPVLKAYGYIPQLKATLDINGIDAIKSSRIMALRPVESFDTDDFFRSLNGILVTGDFASRYRIRKGDMLKAIVYDRQYTLKIAGMIRNESIPPAAAIMDIGNFQEFFGKTGYLTRIDLVADDAMVRGMRPKLPSYLSIEKKSQLIENRKSLLASFTYNLHFISLISVLAGVFLLYNTVFISVVKRRTEIGILRGLGAGKRTIVALFLMQGMLLGLFGSLLGLVLGQCAAYFSVAAVSKTISSMYSPVFITDYFISRADVISTLALGICLSLAASLIPSYEASKIKPNESAKEGTFESRYRDGSRSFLFTGAILIIAGLISSYIDYRAMPFSFPLLSYIGILLILTGFTLISPMYFSKVLNILERPAARIFGVDSILAWGDMRGSTYRLSVALMSVAISTSLIIALLILIFSFRSSLESWIRQNIAADIYVKPASCVSNFCFFPLSNDIGGIIRSFPEVRGIDRFRTLHLDFHGRKIVAGFADIAAQMRYSPRREDKIEKRDSELLHNRQISISNYLAIKYGLKPGDRVEFETPRGRQVFTIYSTFSSYSTTSGFVFLDRKWLKEYWGLDDATQIAVYLKPGTDIESFVARLREALSRRYSVDVMDNRELREKVISIFNKSFAITYAIEIISIAVSLIGVVNTLLALVLERKREISIIRYLGGSWTQIRNMLVLSAGVVGISGIAMGAVIGPLISGIFIYIVNKISFGWEIRFELPLLYLMAVLLALLFTTFAAGFIPAKVARRIDPGRFISFE